MLMEVLWNRYISTVEHYWVDLVAGFLPLRAGAATLLLDLAIRDQKENPMNQITFTKTTPPVWKPMWDPNSVETFPQRASPKRSGNLTRQRQILDTNPIGHFLTAEGFRSKTGGEESRRPKVRPMNCGEWRGLKTCCVLTVIVEQAQIIKRILDEVTAFANGASQRDDVTLMVVRVKDEVGI
jgi:hypothetical protein